MDLRSPIGLCSSTSDAATELAQRLRMDERDLLVRRGGDTSVALAVPRGRRLLAITEDPDGSFVVVDGELYGEHGPLDPDRSARGVLRAWRKAGPQGFASLEMDAAVAIWDAPAAALVLARDRMGQSPLHWSRAADGVVWSGQPSGLLRGGIRPRLDLLAVDSFLASGRAPSPLSFVAGAERVPAATAIIIENGRDPRSVRYWRASAGEPFEGSCDEASEEALRLLGRAVRRRVVTDRTGAFLSAGIDSTLVVATAVAVAGARIPTFTFRYGRDAGTSNEGSAARETAEHLGVEHRELEVTAAMLADTFSTAVGEFDEPLIYGLHSFSLAGLPPGITGLLTGSAGDDLYDAGSGAGRIQRLRKLSPLARRFVLGTWDRLPVQPTGRFGRAITYALEGAPHPVLSTTARRHLYLDPAVATRGRDHLHDLVRTIEREYPDEPPSARELFVEQRLTHDMVAFWNARWARIHGVAIRDPYLDRDFFELLMRVEDRESDQKGLSRRMAATIVPRAVAYRPRQAHSIPVTEWLRGPLRPLVREVLSARNVRDCGVFRPAAVTSMVEEHVRGAADHDWRLLALLTLTQWQLITGVRP